MSVISQLPVKYQMQGFEIKKHLQDSWNLFVLENMPNAANDADTAALKIANEILPLAFDGDGEKMAAWWNSLAHEVGDEQSEANDVRPPTNNEVEDATLALVLLMALMMPPTNAMGFSAN